MEKKDCRILNRIYFPVALQDRNGGRDNMNNNALNGKSWFIRRSSHDEVRLRIFCFPNAGGGASQFVRWINLLLPHTELCSVQLPGRESRLREGLYKDMLALAKDVSTVIAPLCDVPYVFFGHSMGSILAFEVIRHLKNLNIPEPVHLVVSSCPAPHMADFNYGINGLSDKQFIDLLCKYNGLPDALQNDAQLLDLFIPILRADIDMLETYEYKPGEPLSCPITAFGGISDFMIKTEELNSWGLETDGKFDVRMFPGDHFYLNNVSYEKTVMEFNSIIRCQQAC
jgi:medium-chain acyl-[acyl-carrier-protein] hydrolase